MNRPPAFQFYAADWLDLKVMRMSYAAQGVYIRLLVHMWKDSPDQCSLPDDDRALSKMLGLSPVRWHQIKNEIQHHADPIFVERDSLLISARLQAESTKQQQYRKLQSKKGEASGKARFNRGSTVVQPEHQPKGNSSSSVFSLQSSSSDKEEDILSSSCADTSGLAPAEQSKNGKQVRKQNRLGEPSDQALSLATKLRDSLLANFPNSIPPPVAALRQWAYEIDKLNRLDGKTWEQIEWLLAWSQKDPFWSANIQSGAKFRKQWNQLLAKASKEQPQYSAPLTGNEPESSTMRWLREGKEAAAREQQARAEQQERKRQHGE